MTAHTGSAGDMLELANLRKVVKIINKESAQNEKYALHGSLNEYLVQPRFRVKCQGRGPRTSAAISDGRHPRAYDQSLPLSKATRMDVYVYQI